MALPLRQTQQGESVRRNRARSLASVCFRTSCAAAGWGYTDTDARQVLARNRKSFAVLPIKGKDHNAIGVIYLDSTSEVAFLDQPLRGLLVNCCSGITM